MRVPPRLGLENFPRPRGAMVKLYRGNWIGGWRELRVLTVDGGGVEG